MGIFKKKKQKEVKENYSKTNNANPDLITDEKLRLKVMLLTILNMGEKAIWDNFETRDKQAMTTDEKDEARDTLETEHVDFVDSIFPILVDISALKTSDGVIELPTFAKPTNKKIFDAYLESLEKRYGLGAKERIEYALGLKPMTKVMKQYQDNKLEKINKLQEEQHAIALKMSNESNQVKANELLEQTFKYDQEIEELSDDLYQDPITDNLYEEAFKPLVGEIMTSPNKAEVEVYETKLDEFNKSWTAYPKNLVNYLDMQINTALDVPNAENESTSEADQNTDKDTQVEEATND